VAREVLDSAGVTPEEDMRSQQKPATGSQLAPSAGSTSEEPEPKAEAGGEERLSVFEDFLQNLDLDNLDETSSEDDDSDDEKPKKKK